MGRVVRCADNVDAQFLFQYLRVKALDVLGHRISGIREALVTVKALESEPDAVKEEAFRSELRGPAAEGHGLLIELCVI